MTTKCTIYTSVKYLLTLHLKVNLLIKDYLFFNLIISINNNQFDSLFGRLIINILYIKGSLFDLL